MEEKWIKQYITQRGGNVEDRVERHGGGQFLPKYLEEFAKFVRDHTLRECKEAIKKL